MNLEQLQIRLYRVERRQRALGICLFMAAVSAGVALTCGMMPGRPQILETETLLLTDSAGKVRGLFTAGNDEPSLIMTDSRGIKRLRLRIEDHGPTISLYDAEQNLRLQMSGGGDNSEVVLFDGKDTPSLRLRGTRTEPQVVVYDNQGRSRARLFVLDGDQALGSGISLVNEKGEQQILMTALPDGTPVIRAGSDLIAPTTTLKATANKPVAPAR